MMSDFGGVNGGEKLALMLTFDPMLLWMTGADEHMLLADRRRRHWLPPDGGCK